MCVLNSGNSWNAALTYLVGNRDSRQMLVAIHLDKNLTIKLID